jgi:hypothetical protein
VGTVRSLSLHEARGGAVHGFEGKVDEERRRQRVLLPEMVVVRKQSTPRTQPRPYTRRQNKIPSSLIREVGYIYFNTFSFPIYVKM